MKKQNIVISAGIIVLISILLIAWHINRQEVLGNMDRVFREAETGTSDISFTGEKGDKIKFSFRSGIKGGDLAMVLYDSSQNIVYELDKAKELETYFTLEKPDTYTLAAECNKFIGNYKITVYKEN